MRKNEFYKADIAINGQFFSPGYLGSLDNLADWAYEICQSHPNEELRITAKQVIHTGNSQTYIDIPPLDNSETQEVMELAKAGKPAHTWLFTELGLLL